MHQNVKEAPALHSLTLSGKALQPFHILFQLAGLTATITYP